LVLDIADHNGCNPLAAELSDKIARADVPKLLSACAPEAGIAEDGHRQSPGRVLGEIPVDYLVRLEICLNEGTCACRKSNSHIQMMKSAKKWLRQNATNGMYCSRRRRVLVD
jgi:hypothetical protein